MAVLGFGALVVLGNTDVTRPASPPSETPEITYVGCWYGVPHGEVGRRFTAGEDPATLPGVTAVCTSPGPLDPSPLSSSAAPEGHDSPAPTPG